MENKDKIYDQFKEAATKAEDKSFARMDAVWNRVEEKLDKKKERRAAIWWKYTGIAALLLLFMGIGMYLLNNDSFIGPQVIPQNKITVIDTQKIKDEVRSELLQPKANDAVVTAVEPSPVKTGSTKVQPDSINEPHLNKAVVSNTNVYNSANSEMAKVIAKDKYPIADAKAEMAASPVIATKDANENTVYSGTVIFKNDNIPVPGITVAVEGKSVSTLTDFDGNYQIKANPGDVLVFLYLGMKPQRIAVGERKTIDIALLEDVNTLNNVVVEAYRTTTKAKSNVAATTTITAQEVKAPSRKERRKQEKEASQKIVAAAPAETFNAKGWTLNNDPAKETRFYKGRNVKTAAGEKIVDGPTNMYIADVPTDKNTGSAYLDKSAELQNNPDAVAIQALQGRMAGIKIDPSESLFKNPVAIRGVTSIQTSYNDPLYIIDGLPASAGVLKSIDPENIESINVLKDNAATSLWGTRAYNGAIIIKTKKLSRKQKKQLKKAIEESQQAGYLDTTSGKFVPMEKIKIDTEEYESFEENKFENPATAPLSTFSIDVDNASYTNVRRFINNGQTVPKDAVRVEEMINFFKYSYPQPKGNDPFSVNTEYSDAPWNPKHKLLKIGLQGKELATKNLPASNFVFLIDVSGSMNEPNKLPLLKQSMKILVNQMRKQDKIAIVVYAGAAGLVLPSTSGADKDKIIAALDNLSAGGSTAGGAGIELAYKTAQDNFAKGGNNRVILATDGDFNVGASSDADMQTLIEAKRKSGVFLTCLGYGMGNYKDSKLETLADKGNGNYAYIDNMQEADRFLDKEFKGSMYAIAKDVKIQIEFNPKHVQSYRLIGYENRKLRDEDFANDAIDAGELGSGHTVTALYEIIPVGVQSDFFTPTSELKYSQTQAATDTFNDELATIKLRHKKPDGDVSNETISIIPNTTVTLQQASADFKFAAAVAWFGLKLRDSNLVPNKTTKEILELAKQGLLYDPEGYRAEFLRLVQMVE